MTWVLYYYPHFPENMQLKLREVKSSSKATQPEGICALASAFLQDYSFPLTCTLWHIVHAQSCPTLRPHGLYPAKSPWDFPGKNTGAGCHFLLQRIFLITDGTCISYVSCTGWHVFFFCLFFYQLIHQGRPSFSPPVSCCVYAPSPSSPSRSLV